MDHETPRLSVGMPVYNGERFIAQAIESILSQTFRDLELVICDNASTDSTEQICREYAGRDQRVRYYRNPQNYGASRNYNLVVELAKGDYLKWQAHDDYCDPTFLEKCFAVVHDDPRVALCYSQFVRVDEQGRELGVKSSRVVGNAEPYERFRSLIYRRDSCEEIFGVMRTDVVRETAMIGPYSNSDDTFLAEMILRGQFREVPEPLFFYRIHPKQSTAAHPSRSERMAWFNSTANTRFTFPFVRVLGAYTSLVWRSPLTWREKMRCYSCLAGWSWYFRDWFREDLGAVRSSFTRQCLVPWFRKHAPWTRPLWHAAHNLRDGLRRPQSARTKARLSRREQLERWEVNLKP
jgi:glycosyltransferase involved in cell wall biosynthesis